MCGRPHDAPLRRATTTGLTTSPPPATPRRSMTTFDSQQPTTRRHPAGDIRLSDVGRRFADVGRRLSNVETEIAASTTQGTDAVAPKMNNVASKTDEITAKTDELTQIETQVKTQAANAQTTKSTTEVTSEGKWLGIAFGHDLNGSGFISDLLRSVGISDREDFRKRYLRTALESGLVEMTQPNSPRSPTQKYRLTAKGRELLSSMSSNGEGATP